VRRGKGKVSFGFGKEYWSEIKFLNWLSEGEPTAQILSSLSSSVNLVGNVKYGQHRLRARSNGTTAREETLQLR